MSAKIFVGNLEHSTSKEELQALFAAVGTIRDVFLPTDRETGRPRGFAFVEFESESEASTAVQRFDGHELRGRNLRVNAAEERAPRAPGSGPPRSSWSGPSAPAEPRFAPAKPKGSRRNLRARKRSL